MSQCIDDFLALLPSLASRECALQRPLAFQKKVEGEIKKLISARGFMCLTLAKGERRQEYQIRRNVVKLIHRIECLIL